MGESSPRPATTEADLRLAETVRAACLAAAREAYEDAGLSGLCGEGRFEAALSAISSLDLTKLTSTPAEADEERRGAS